MKAKEAGEVDMLKANYYHGNIIILRIFWIFFFINILAIQILGGPYLLRLALMQLMELAILLLVNFFMGYSKQASVSEEASLKTVLGELDIVTWSSEPGKNKFFFSVGIAQITGYTASDLNKRPELFRKLIHPYDLYRVRKSEKELLAGKKSIVEYRILIPNGQIRWIKNMAIPLKDRSGRVYRLEGLIIDVTREKETEEKMTRMALYDALTGLPNRSMFEKYFTYFVARNKHMPQRMAVVFIDLDAFKEVNDTLGHDKGDLLLKEVTIRLNNIFRGTDLLSRLGGDEFIALLTRITKESLIVVSERIIATFSEPFVIDGQELVIGASIGISVSPDDGEELEILIRNADQAMYGAKAKGKNTYQFYNESFEG
jgi:diguanylate cyclase (GGDEF)-like protein/PAS domain S-box-containing protein